MLRMCLPEGTDENLDCGRENSLIVQQRFHSKAVLDHMHHEVALQEWVKVRDGQEVPLERALAAFDLFVIQDYEEGFESVCSLSMLGCIYTHHQRSPPGSIVSHNKSAW